MSGGQSPGPVPKRQPKRVDPPPPARRQRPRELERIEAEIEAKERLIADLERRLADDWNDFDLVAAHQREREELKLLLVRWEELFDAAEA